MSGRVREGVDREGVWTLVLEREGGAPPVLDRALLERLDLHLEEVERDRGATGLVIAARAGGDFAAGADLFELQWMIEGRRWDAVLEGVRLGRRVLARLASQRVPTVAAIEGACLGGGLELALCCRERVAADDPSTRIGFPETRLGLLPAWGGCARLPGLVGMRAALGLVLPGRPVSARAALRAGLVDAVVPRSALAAAARRRAREARSRPRRFFVSNFPLVADALAAVARRRADRETRGLVAAPARAARVLAAAAARGAGPALDFEAEAFLELVRTPAAVHLVGLFVRTEEARRAAGTPGAPGLIAVVGAGTMGAAIAQWASSRGHRVILRDLDADRVRAGMEAAAALYRRAVERGALGAREARDGMDRIVPAPVEVPLRGAAAVIEAVTEAPIVKQAVLARKAAIAGPQTILATNTSSLPVDGIADAVPDPGRLVGLHFFHPVHRMPLVEVVAGARTAPAIVERAAALVAGLGKVPIVVKDRPGFLVNRVLAPYLLEAVRLVEEGARVDAVDGAMRDFGMAAGPLRTLDEVGLDIALAVAARLEEALGERFRAPDLARRLADTGALGRKAGRGFLRWTARGPAGPAALPAGPRAPGPAPGRDEIGRRLVLLLVNEAARAHEEGIAASADLVDLALVLGAGFAPMRGGPLAHADAVGAAGVVEQLRALEAARGPRFAPAAVLVRLAEDGAHFHPAPRTRPAEERASREREPSQ